MYFVRSVDVTALQHHTVKTSSFQHRVQVKPPSNQPPVSLQLITATFQLIQKYLKDRTMSSDLLGIKSVSSVSLRYRAS